MSLHKWKCKNGSLRINPGSGEGQVLLSNYFSVFGKTKIILPFTWFGNFQLSLPLKLRKIAAYSNSILLAGGSLISSAINSLYFLLTPALNLGPNLPPCILFIVLSISWSNSIYSLTHVSFSVFIHSLHKHWLNPAKCRHPARCRGSNRKQGTDPCLCGAKSLMEEMSIIVEAVTQFIVSIWPWKCDQGE